MTRKFLQRGLIALAAGVLLLATAGPATAQPYGYRYGYHYGYRPYYHYRYWYGVSPYYPAWASPYYPAIWGSPYYTPVTSPYGAAYDLPALAALASALGGASAAPAPSSSVPPAPTPATTAETARITVRLPAAAELWVNGALMAQTGSVRVFDTPPLTAGQRYTYTVRARWTESGRPVEQTQTVGFAPGDHIDVTFPAPSGL